VGVDVAEVARQREAAHLTQRARQLHAGGPAAHDHEGEERALSRRVALDLRAFVGGEHAPPDLRRLLQGLEARRELLPLVVAEVEVAGPGREDQVVVGERPGVGEHAPAFEVHAADLLLSHARVGAARQQAADGRGDLRGAEARHRHLVEQGLEEVVVAAIHQGDLDLA
jgi:hypothetical protein